MKQETNHITPYAVYVKVLIVLLGFTILTVTATHIHLGAFTVALALIIACIKATAVLTYFMHLKFDDIILRIFVIMVFVLLAVVVFITLIDYINR
jgi:cytochrome c oxidase subunit IV